MFVGAGAAAMACLDLLVKIGLKKENIIVCDSKGVIHEDRGDEMPETKKICTKQMLDHFLKPWLMLIFF